MNPFMALAAIKHPEYFGYTFVTRETLQKKIFKEEMGIRTQTQLSFNL